MNREQMEVELECTAFKLRMVAAALNLRWAQKYRVNDLQLLLTRDTESGDTKQSEELIKLKENALEYERELTLKDKGLVRVRREANRLRAQMRTESIEDALLAVVESVKEVEIPLAPLASLEITEQEGIDFIILSDFHAGATVKVGDVPDNLYSWEVLETRLHSVMAKAVSNKAGNICDFYLLGDMLDGIIHDSLEASDVNPAEAAKKLAHLIAAYILQFSRQYGQVRVYCLNGNHSRLTQNIKSNGKGFDFEYLMYSILEALTVNLVSHFEISTVGMLTVEVSPGVFAGLHHGDNFRGASNSASRDLQIQERFRQVGPEVAHIIQGHTHVYESHVLSTGGFSICNGSLIGTNGYVHTNGIIPVTTVQVLGNWTLDGQLGKVIPVVL